MRLDCFNVFYTIFLSSDLIYIRTICVILCFNILSDYDTILRIITYARKYLLSSMQFTIM